MAITHSLATAYQGGSGLALSTSTIFTGNQEFNISVTAVNGWNDHAIDYDFVEANLVSLFILSSQDVTLQFVVAGTVDTEIGITANVPYIWYAELGASPFTGDVDSLLVTNASGTDALLNIRTLLV